MSYHWNPTLKWMFPWFAQGTKITYPETHNVFHSSLQQYISISFSFTIGPDTVVLLDLTFWG